MQPYKSALPSSTYFLLLCYISVKTIIKSCSLSKLCYFMLLFMYKTFYHSIRTISFVITLSITSQVMAQDACVSGTVPAIGCVQLTDDGTFDLTGDITPTSGLSAIRFIDADRNTFNYTGNISTGAYGSIGFYISNSTFNNITINGNIDVGAAGLYGITSYVSTGSNTIIMNGNITTKDISVMVTSLFMKTIPTLR